MDNDKKNEKKSSQPTAKKTKRFSMEAFLNQVSNLRSLLANILLIIVVVLFIIFLYQQSNKDVISIEPFEVPVSLSEKGYSGQVFVNRLNDEINKIVITASTLKEAIGLNASWLENYGDFEVPTTGLSVNTLMEIVRELLGNKPIRITGEVVLLDNDQINLTLRIPGKPEKSINGNLGNPDNRILEEAAKYVFEMTDPYILAAYVYNSGNEEEAIKVIRQQCINNARYSKKDDRKWIYNLWGNALFGLENYRGAVAKYDSAVIMDPDFARAYYNWGNALFKMEDFTQAADKYRKAIGLNPVWYDAYLNLGLALKEDKQLDESVKALRIAAEINPNNYKALSIWEEVLRMLGEKQAADSLSKKVAALKPQGEIAESQQNLTDQTYLDIKSWGYIGQLSEISDEEKETLKAANSARDRLLDIVKQETAEQRSTITVEYFPKGVDPDSVKSALQQLGFTFKLKTSDPRLDILPTNAIWYGSGVKVDYAKAVALTLIRAGVDIKSIRPFRNSYGRKQKLIQVGTDARLYAREPLSVDFIEEAETFNR